MRRLSSVITLVICLALSMPVPSQVPASGATTSPSAAAPSPSKSFSQQELDQLLAPIALYPDPLVAQVLMASTYPLEIAMADRWTKQNSSLKGDPLTKALEAQDWD